MRERRCLESPNFLFWLNQTSKLKETIIIRIQPLWKFTNTVLFFMQNKHISFKCKNNASNRDFEV